MSRFKSLAITMIYCTVYIFIGCHSTTDPRTATTTPSIQTQSVATNKSAAPESPAELSIKDHPAFKLYSQKVDKPTAVVVPENTTDEQLTKLLWYFRAQVRSKKFAQLGLTKPTDTRWGKSGFGAGMLVVFRGAKCAKENDIDSGAGPCGYGSHDSAEYQWGVDNDPAKDYGSIFAIDGDVKHVFDSSDGWRPADQIAQDPSGYKSAQISGQIEYARQLSLKFLNRDSVTVFHPGPNGDELIGQSVGFATERGRDSFIMDFVLDQKDRLCALGFRHLLLGKKSSAGKSYPVGCST